MYLSVYELVINVCCMYSGILFNNKLWMFCNSIYKSNKVVYVVYLIVYKFNKIVYAVYLVVYKFNKTVYAVCIMIYKLNKIVYAV